MPTPVVLRLPVITPNVSATFEFEKETKNKVRFREIVDADVVPAIEFLYLHKSEFEELGWPQTVTVTVSAGSSEQAA